MTRNAKNIARSTSRLARRGFTLVELIVALGAALLLTVGVGIIFQNVSAIVSQGSAVAEVDQLARSIESQIREDFQSINAMNAEDTFLAIRNRLETDVYLREEDRLADLREGVEGTVLSRIIRETRLDEIMFIGQSGREGGFPTYELNPINSLDAGGVRLANSLPTSPHARIYYGHGMRPVRIPRDIAPTSTFPRVPDGDFGSAAGDDNIYETGTVTYDVIDPETGAMSTDSVDTTLVSAEERNRYSGAWPLARHALLLHPNGGDIMGINAPSGPSPVNSIISLQREYAPFIRDHESEFRFQITDGFPDPGESETAFSAPPTATNFNAGASPNPRLIRHGRTDIGAQSLEDVRRWLEGFGVITSGGNIQFGADASAWTGGAWDTYPPPVPGPIPGSNTTAPADRDAPLWTRTIDLSNPSDVTNRLEQNLVGLQSAIAGAFFRPLVETTTPIVPRVVDTSVMNNTSTTTEDALMDTHALLASRCSRLEIAWSDGSRWDNRTQELSNATEPSYFRPESESVSFGELIWFDYNFTRRDLWTIAPRYRIGALPGEPRARQDPEILPNTAPSTTLADAPVFRENWNNAEPNERDNRLAIDPDSNGSLGGPSGLSPVYDPLKTGGGVGEDENSTDDDTEYMAIFPFRSFANQGDRAGFAYDRPFPKPQFIRFRMTLHDSQLRLRDGKDFEFIVRVNPE